MDHTAKMAELEKRLQFLEGKEAERERAIQKSLNIDFNKCSMADGSFKANNHSSSSGT
jgi:hypothetical protein